MGRSASQSVNGPVNLWDKYPSVGQQAPACLCVEVSLRSVKATGASLSSRLVNVRLRRSS